MADNTETVSGDQLEYDRKSGKFRLKDGVEPIEKTPESTHNAKTQPKRVKTPPKPAATQPAVKFDKLITGIQLMPKKRPRGAQVFPALAKQALAKVSRKSWPVIRFYMPAKYTKHIKALQAAFGIHELGTTPHQVHVWVTRAMPKSWTKAKKAEMLGRFIMSGSAGHIPDCDNALGCIMDALFPQQKQYNWQTNKDELKPGTGDDAIVKATIEMRWADVDSIRVQLEPLEDTAVLWSWLPKKKGELF